MGKTHGHKQAIRPSTMAPLNVTKKISKKTNQKRRRSSEHFNCYETDVYITPLEVFIAIFNAFGVDLQKAFDPCPFPASHRNGLDIDWEPVAFVNPPFSQIKEWVIKAIEQANRGVTTYMILPWQVFYYPNYRVWSEKLIDNYPRTKARRFQFQSPLGLKPANLNVHIV